LKYRREIDGLRSLAVIPVIFFHAGVTIFSGGYVGVDIFFVISGYLITSIIVSERQTGNFTITNFYERRARRILPALLLVMIACVPFAWAWMTPLQLKDFSQSLTAVSLFSSNVLFLYESEYFGPSAELKPLLHTWSLAVEEQYYIFFPIFILAVWRFGKKILFYALLLIGFASFLLSQWGSANYPIANFYLLPTRVWELLIGSLVAIHLLYKERRITSQKVRFFRIEQCLSGLGFALILYSIFTFDDETPFPSFYALVPTVGTALIILYASEKTLVARLLSAKLPVGIGLISFSAYLWHQPLFAFARLRSISEPSHELMLLLGFLSLVLAFISWRYIEKPFRNKSKYSRSQIFYLAAIATVCFVGIGFFGHVNQGFPYRTMSNGNSYADNNYGERIRVNHGLSKTCEKSFTLHEDCRTSNQPEILVWGDSFAMHLTPGILSSNDDAKIIQMTKSVCGPIIGLAPFNKKWPEKWSKGCLDFNESVAQWVKANTSLRYAVLSSPFGQYLSDDWKMRTTDGVVDSDKATTYKYFTSTLDFLISQGVQPVIFAPPPGIGPERDIGACLVKSSILGDDLGGCDFSAKSYKDKKNNVIRFLEKVDQNYEVIWMDEFLCDNERCTAAVNEIFIFRDGGHFSYEGSAFIGNKMNFYEIITNPNKEK